MSAFPKTSGDLDAYEFYIETALHWHCASCATHVEVTGDVLPGEEEKMPYGAWAVRQGHLGMQRGWYVPPLTKEGSLVLTTLCPECVRKGGLEVKKAPNQPSQPTSLTRRG